MRPLDLNLASRPFRNNTLLWTGYAVAAVLLVSFTAWNVERYRQHGELLGELRVKVDGVTRQMTDLGLRDERARIGIQKFDLQALAVQSEKANDVIGWRAFSWTRLFNLLEDLQPYRVKMLSVRPAFYAAERRFGQEDLPEGAVPVHVEGIAEELRTFFAFQRSLLMDPHVDRVEPEKSARLESGEVKFELKFLYFPDPPTSKETADLPPVIEVATPKDYKRLEEEWKRKQAGEGEPADAESGETG